MSFDEVLFPLPLAAGTCGGPTFATEIVTIQGGFERRNQKWQQPRRRYNAQGGVVSLNDVAILLAFFQARAGRARGFRLRDPVDHSSAADGASAPAWNDQLLGTGDGVRTQFQLVKTYGSGTVSFTRSIKKPVAGSVKVGVGGVAYATSWSVDASSGIVTFAQPPANGASVQAGFLFDVPVRFDTDKLDLGFLDHGRAESEIPLLEIRVP